MKTLSPNRFLKALFRNIHYLFLATIFIYLCLEFLDFIDQRIGALEQFSDFFSVSSSFFLATLTSFVFYYLVVEFPEARKRAMIKSNLASQYRQIKRGIIRQVIFASIAGGRKDLRADAATVSKLCTVEGFVAAFSGGRESDEGFYAFRNHMSDDVPEFREIIFGLKMLAKQIDFVLHNYPVSDPEVFAFFKRLEFSLLRIEYAGPGYDEEEGLSRLIWEIFGGSSGIDRPINYDIVEKMISDI